MVIDRTSGQVVGSSRYYEWDEAAREVAIDFTFLARSQWGGASNAEMKRPMLEHAFQRVDRVWFHVATTNGRSARAMAKIGATLSHQAVKRLNGTDTPYVFFCVDAQDPWRGAQLTGTCPPP